VIDVEDGHVGRSSLAAGKAAHGGQLVAAIRPELTFATDEMLHVRGDP
jgi:hypothetical protein